MAFNFSILPFIVISACYLGCRLFFDVFRLKAHKDSEWWLVGLPVSLLSAGTLVAPYLLGKISVYLGSAHLFLSLAAVLLLLLSIHSKLSMDRLVIVINLISFLVSMVVVMVFWINGDKFKRNKQLEIEQIESSFSKFEESFQSIATKIEKEKKELGFGLKQLSIYISSQMDVLKDTEESLRQRQIELDHYEKMLSISAEQRDAFMQDFDRANSFWSLKGISTHVFSGLIGIFLTFLATRLSGFINQWKKKN